MVYHQLEILVYEQGVVTQNWQGAILATDAIIKPWLVFSFR